MSELDKEILERLDYLARLNAAQKFADDVLRVTVATTAMATQAELTSAMMFLNRNL